MAEEEHLPNVPPDNLSTDRPYNCVSLIGFTGNVSSLAAVPGGELLATVSGAGVHIYALAIGGGALSTCMLAAGTSPILVAALRADLIVLSSVGTTGTSGSISTWRASMAKRHKSLSVDTNVITSICLVSKSSFAVGTSLGCMKLATHSHVVGLSFLPLRGPGGSGQDSWFQAHDKCIHDIASCGITMVTASADLTAKVWNRSHSGGCAAVIVLEMSLKGHKAPVLSAAINKTYIATGSVDQSYRIYKNGGEYGAHYALIRVYEGLHQALRPAFGTNNVLMPGGGSTMQFMSSVNQLQPSMDVGFSISAMAVMPNHRIAVGSLYSRVEVLSLPPVPATFI